MAKRHMALWTEAVHAHCMAANVGLTPDEAERLFGKPSGNQPPSKMLGCAAANGYFVRRAEVVEGRIGTKTVGRYFAVNKVKERKAERAKDESYFAGMRRVRSVFDLGVSP